MGGEPLVVTDGDPLVELATRLQAVCLTTGRTVALAESCTGGMVSAALTAVSGSSGYFVGGVVSYSNDAKRNLLGVDPAILDAHGAVSAQVARAMAIGARERLGADIGAAVTGIAGPDGGSAAKPVGLTYVGVADEAGSNVRRVVWPGDRAANRMDSTILVLEVLLARLEPSGEPSAPPVEGSSAPGPTRPADAG
ncbi:MAG: CinA family protein [Chloroflexi bacterium]|nr:CinA family protein [Chloroflexota bacterium]